MTDLDTRRPEFTIGIRGYDRTQVDEYVEYLKNLIVEADGRARDAETEYVFDEHAAVGPRVAEIFALAEAEARELRERVASDATRFVSDARVEAKAIIDAAEHAAREVKERLRRDQAEMVTELESHRDRIRDEVAALELRRTEAIAELNRLRDTLGEAAGALGSGRPTAKQALPRGDGETVELPAIAEDIDEP